jgi:multidrug resistance efflux pump
LSVPRDQSVRNRIVAYLAEHGAIEDVGGKATATLKKAIGYEGTDAGFTQVVAAMAKAGLLTRQIKGKRTYRISNSGKGEGRSAATTGGGVPEGPIDYDELAAVLLAQVTRAAAAPTDASESATWARRRLEQLEARNAVLQRDVARANAEAEAVAAERDVLRDQLEAAQHNLSLLTDRLQEPRRPQSRAAERLGPDEQTLLHQLRRRPPRTASSGRAI